MDFKLNGAEYRATKLDVFAQLKVSRKLLPLIATIVSDIQMLKEAGGEGGDKFKALETILPKIAGSIADMPDENVNAILFPCLSVVTRKTAAGNWTPVFTQDSLMFDDIDLFAMITIAGRVVVDNMGNFLPAAPTSETADQ